MTTENVETKIYKSLPQPNEDKPITVDTFSPCPVLLSRIREFNGVKIDINIVAVYGYLLGWKKTTGRVTVSIPRISDDCAGISESTVKRARKALKKMGWIDWKTIPDEGKSNTSHCIYTVKDPDDILAELNAGLSQQGDAVVTIAKKQKVKTEESGKSEQKRDVESFVVGSAAPAAGKPDGIPAVDIPVDVDLSNSDDPLLSDSTGRNVVEFPRNGRPKPSFKFVAPDDDDHEEIHQEQETFIEPDVCHEPTPEEIDAAVALM
ncbi:helix-turn-helix domain-containing protein [Pseudenterobacter timonensis]|uniref:Helix-turn-helix domain-containing protein n=1 Tax=Pseudenterobacter timonensis TaxID=1755099 RepID=A0AAE4DR48_9ENTR|nr:helix-turn-helix domain-containing protein [Pseudenterobacter timonensis]MCM7717976.1 helix-turn-helix domain-containing protein [Enterobacter hormaechei]MDR9891498.1 helix-turn-helix domain-containing protein [Pseudenterobacter timonensis]